jgi:hypothetical protein
MTAMDGGERPLDIFPLPGDVNRGRLMQETWRAFAAENGGRSRGDVGGRLHTA